MPRSLPRLWESRQRRNCFILTEHPYKGNTDPILYRLHEVIDTVDGPALKDLIREQGGKRHYECH